MKPVEYTFTIDAFTPDTIPMARLAEYLAALAKMIGHEDSTHFVKIEPGSAQIVQKVDPVDAPKVVARLDSIRSGEAPPRAMKAQNKIEELLANDNAKGVLTERVSGRLVLDFGSIARPEPVLYPPFRESAVIQGQIIRIGGRDTTSHATLQEGETFHTGINMSRDIAKELANLLYGPVVRLIGTGRFERQADGSWEMSDFRVEEFEPLKSAAISDALNSIRCIPKNGLMKPDAYWKSRSLTQDREEG